MSLIPLFKRDEPEVVKSAKKLTLDEAHKIACEYGRPEIGSAWNGTSACELKLSESIAGSHYISLKCAKYPTPAENLMELVSLAERMREVLR